jgi:hypothetical protein
MLTEPAGTDIAYKATFLSLLYPGVGTWLFALFALAAVLQTIRESARAVIAAIHENASRCLPRSWPAPTPRLRPCGGRSGRQQRRRRCENSLPQG